MASTSTSPLETWALPRLQQLLPLDEESLRQVITYADTLPKDAAAEHLKNFLGEEPYALEFIEGFNLRRQKAPPTAGPKDNGSISSSSQQSPASGSQQPWKANHGGKPKKKKANIHALPARQLEGHGNVTGGYKKRDEEDYMPASMSAKQKHKDQIAENLALRPADATQMPLITGDASLTKHPITHKPPPSAAGPLISDALAPRSKKAPSSSSPRPSSPAPAKTKVNLTGGTAMHGASTALSDLDSAIRRLEIQTNPTLSSADSPDDPPRRACPCMATRHPLLDIAPNCLACGKIICVREGLGPCTFCGSPLLAPADIAAVLRVLKAERGDERTRLNNAAHRRPEVSTGKARAYTGRDFLAATATGSAGSSARSSPLPGASPVASANASEDEGEAKARAHRDRLLGFQANNARRTRVHDEAADFDVPASGTNMWASPAERAQQLKRQQRVLREMEWNARPEYEKRKVVASIDLVGKKVVRRMAEVERPDFGAEEDEEGGVQVGAEVEGAGAARETGGAFSLNPLAKGLIKPVAKESKGKEKTAREKGNMWRRVQMDGDDNEQWILDGGIYGGKIPSDRVLGEEEHAVGS